MRKLAESKKKESSKKTKQVINKSMLVIEVKPADADTDLDDICKKVKAIEMEGVKWGEGSKKVPVAFGLYKLQVGSHVFGKVVTDMTVSRSACKTQAQHPMSTRVPVRRKRLFLACSSVVPTHYGRARAA